MENNKEIQDSCKLLQTCVSGSLSIGKIDKDRFANVLKDGEETKCRLYLWDAEDVKRLQSIGDRLHRENCH
jgi:hypothetical protein